MPRLILSCGLPRAPPLQLFRALRDVPLSLELLLTPRLLFLPLLLVRHKGLPGLALRGVLLALQSDPRVHHLINHLPELRDALLHQKGLTHLSNRPLGGKLQLVKVQGEHGGAIAEQDVEEGLQLPHVLEVGDLAEHVQPQPCTGHRDDHTAAVPDVAHVVRAHQREQNIVVLSALELIHGRNMSGHPKDCVRATAVAQHIPKKKLLPVVRREDGDFLCGVPEQPHVHVRADDVLRFTKILKEVRLRLGFSLPVVVRYVDALVLVGKPAVCDLEGGVGVDVREVPQAVVFPAVQVAQAGPHSALCVELDCGHPQPDQSGEEALVHVGILLEGHVLHHRGKLVVVPDQHHPLQPAASLRGRIL
eukprot:RCo027050